MEIQILKAKINGGVFDSIRFRSEIFSGKRKKSEELTSKGPPELVNTAEFSNWEKEPRGESK